MVLIRPMRAARGARRRKLRHRGEQPCPEEESPAAVSESSKRWKSHSASSALIAKPPANESTLKSAASFHTTPREDPSACGVSAAAARTVPKRE
jgi:hypothetical protein